MSKCPQPIRVLCFRVNGAFDSLDQHQPSSLATVSISRLFAMFPYALRSYRLQISGEVSG